MHLPAPSRRWWWLLPAFLLLFLAGWLVPRIPPAYDTPKPGQQLPDQRHGATTVDSTSPSNVPLPAVSGRIEAPSAWRPQEVVGRPVREEHAIRLVTHLINTATASPAGAPAAEAARMFAGSPARVWIVQLDGPVRAEDKAALTAAGATLCGYVPNNAFAVKMTAALLSRVASVARVQWIGPYLPEYKLAPMLDRTATGRATLDLATFSPAEVAEAAAAVVAAGGAVVGRKDGPLQGRVRAEVDLRRVPELAAADSIQWIEPEHAMKLFNNRAVEGPRLNVTNVWATHGLTGSNQFVAVADTGLDTGNLLDIHPDFSNRVAMSIAFGRANDWSDPQGHGTHVCGSVLGDGFMSNGKYRGTAPAALLMIESLYTAAGGLAVPSDLFDLFHPVYSNGARIHSDSWGSSASGFYTSQSRDVDEFIWVHPDFSVFFAAGNDGTDANGNGVVDLDSLGSPATAKNTVSVGASENFHNGGEASGLINGAFGNYATPIRFDGVSQPYDGVHQGMACFSSRGPCDDGRVKPDLVAPGTDIISTRSRSAGGTAWGVAPDNSNYLINGGTSMATPLAAGCAALVRQFFVERTSHTNPSAALVKAAMINGANSLFPGQYGTGANLEIPAGHRPNSVEGWGQVDVEGSLFPAAPVSVAYVEGAGLGTAMTNTHLLILGGTNALRVTLCWSDFPGSPGSSKSLVNDLDLRVIAPDGSTNHHRLQGAPDHTNNVEGIDLPAAVPGLYRVEVSGFNVPQGPQPYALVVRGPLAPTIEHAPLPNTTDTSGPYAVDASIILSSGRVDTNQLFVRWNTDGSTNFAAAPMSLVTGDTYRAQLPGQPVGTTVRYYIDAATNGLVATHPAGAPQSLHAFQVTPPVMIAVLGSPVQVGDVQPPYGLTTYAAGNIVTARAPAFASDADLRGYVCTGWLGNGSVPFTGNTNECVFVATQVSFVAWMWEHTSYGLAQTSQPAGIVDTVSWWPVGGTGTTVTAPASAVLSGTVHRFAGWYENGVRLPSDVAVASAAQGGFVMTGAHRVAALYLPETQDTDHDGMPDWWEMFHYGTNNAPPTVDDDGDGFLNQEEYGDRTNPRDSTSKPAAPVILHVPLADPQPHPAPFTVSAVVTDNFALASVTLWWYRGAPPWNVTNMTPAAGNTWQADIPGPGTNFETFAYLISASDPGGRTTLNGVHAFSVGYPVMIVSPTNLGPLLVARGATAETFLAIANLGNGPLAWTARVEQIHIEEDVESGAPGWTHSGVNDEWHISTVRPYRGACSWYLGNDISGVYKDAEDARLLMPPVTPGSNAVLTFRSWINCELDSGIYAWDGGVIEVSTNGGASFFSVEPEGGYPYRITPNPDSPFPAETPCLAGDGGWELVTVPLADFAGQTIRIRFRFGSDHYVVEEGWFIDDIVVRSTVDAGGWLAPAAPTGVVGRTASSNLLLRVNGAALPAGDYRAAVEIGGSDTDNPADTVMLSVSVRSAPEVTPYFAAQTSTNGEGLVTVSNLVFDGDGDLVQLRAEASLDGGVNWTGLVIQTALASTGSIVISNSSPWQLQSLSASVSNRVTFVWPTTGTPAVAVCTSTLLRVAASDGVFTGSAVTAAAFIVDNAAPSAAAATAFVHSAFGAYVVAPRALISWTGFSDAGFGASVFYVARTNGGGTTAGAPFPSPGGVVTDLVAGVTNIFFVWAADAAGNIGQAVTASAVPLAAAGDADGDGYPNGDEEIAGTSATNANSWLRLTEVATVGGTRRVVRWPHVANRLYLLHLSDEAGGLPAVVLTNPPVEVVGGIATFDLTNAPTGSFQQFRLGVRAP